MKNAIAFSLYGKHPRYLLGAQRNYELASKYYPDWHCWFCVEESQPKEFFAEFVPMDTIFQIRVDVPDMMRRLLVPDFAACERVIFRDCDSRISEREVAAVEAWIQSDKILHIMRDHPAHRLVPGGMFGIQILRDNWEMPSMLHLIHEWMDDTELDPHSYGADEDFLDRKIWPMLNNSVIQHDCIPGRRNELKAWNCQPWPVPRTRWPRFVGEVWDIDETGTEYPRPGDWEQVPQE